MATRWRDPLVGREILFGVAAGVGLIGVQLALLVPAALGAPPRVIMSISLRALLGATATLGELCELQFGAIQSGLFYLFVLTFLRVVLRGRRLAAAAFVAFLAVFTATFTAQMGGGGHPVDWLVSVAAGVAYLALLTRVGLLAMVVAIQLQLLTLFFPWASFDPSEWPGGLILLLLLPVGLAMYGLVIARGGQPLFTAEVE